MAAGEDEVSGDRPASATHEQPQQHVDAPSDAITTEPSAEAQPSESTSLNPEPGSQDEAGMREKASDHAPAPGGDAPPPAGVAASETTTAVNKPTPAKHFRLYEQHLVVANLQVGVLPRAQVPGRIAASVDAAAVAVAEAAAQATATIPMARDATRRVPGARIKERSIYQPKINYVRDGAPLALGPVAAGVEAPVPVGVHMDPTMQELFDGPSFVAPADLPAEGAPPVPPPQVSKMPEEAAGVEQGLANQGGPGGAGAKGPAEGTSEKPGASVFAEMAGDKVPAKTTRVNLSDLVPEDAAAALVAKGDAEVLLSGPYAMPAWKHPLYLANAPHWGDHDILPAPLAPGHPRGEEWLFEGLGDRESEDQHEQQQQTPVDAADQSGKLRTLDQGPSPRPRSWAREEGGSLAPVAPAEPLPAPYCINLQLRVPPRLPSLPVRVAHLLTLQGTRSSPAPGRANVLTSSGKPPLLPVKVTGASALFAQRARPDRTSIGKNQGGIQWPEPMSTLHTVLHRPQTDVRVVQWGPPPVQSVWLKHDSLLLVTDPVQPVAQSKLRYMESLSKPFIPRYSVRGFAERKEGQGEGPEK